MRITVLQQQTKALQAERADGTASSKQIESIEHLLWHGNVDEALDRIDCLFMDLDLISRQSAPAEKLAAGISDLRTYIGNTRGSIPNYGERYRQGDDDQHGLCGIDDQPSRQPPVREDAADALDTEGSAPVVTDADEGSQQRTG
jgi:hypothetical protein